jgi:hypothetical protein
MNPKYNKRLNDAYGEYQRLIRGLSERTLKLRLTALANKGDSEIDPFIRALARRELEAMDAQAKLASAQEELKSIRSVPEDMHFPGQPDKRALMALRKQELEQSVAGQMARAVGIAGDPMLRAREEAIKVYQAQEAEAARLAAVYGRVAEKKAAMADAELDAAADRILAGQSVDKGA